MASEFSYEDIASQNYKNYEYGKEDAEKIVKNGVEYFKVTRVPKDKNSGYSKQIVYVNTKTYLVSFGEYYDRQERLLKNIFFTDYKKIDGVYRVGKISIVNVQNSKSTTLVWDEDKIDVGLKEREFSKRSLK